MSVMTSCFTSGTCTPMRAGVTALAVMGVATAAFALTSAGDAGQKVATAMEEMSLVMVLLLLHMIVSKYRGEEDTKRSSKKKIVDEGDASSGAPEAEPQCDDDEACQQAIGKITTKIRAAVKSGDMKAAEALMRHMQEVGGAPGQHRRACWSVAFGEIVNGFVRDGNATRAGKWLDEFAACAPIIRPSTACVNSVITALCVAGLVEDAEAWLVKMPQAGVRVDEDTFNAIINGSVRAGRVPRAIHWLREMRKANMRPNAELNKLVLQACAQAHGHDAQ